MNTDEIKKRISAINAEIQFRQQRLRNSQDSVNAETGAILQLRGGVLELQKLLEENLDEKETRSEGNKGRPAPTESAKE